MKEIALSELSLRLLSWYAREKRSLPFREDPAPYHVWVSEIMLQQTRVEAVLSHYRQFIERFPTIRSLAEADGDELLKYWEGLGYYSRARNMKRAAEIVLREYGGELPADYEALKALPGFGEYTAGAVASIAFRIPVPAVDGNVKRVFLRLWADAREIQSPAVLRDVRAAAERAMDTDHPGDFNQALMELGATVCLPNGAPKCGVCPLATLCRAYAEDIANALPKRRTKKPRRLEKRTVFVIVSAGKVLLRKREEGGLLHGLFELPGVSGWLSESEAAARAEQWGANVKSVTRLPDSRHVFSHVEWDMRAYRVESGAMPPPDGWVFASEAELHETYALPSAFSAYRESIFLPGGGSRRPAEDGEDA